ncbi:MAG: YkgJ family cysteine cluster protein [Planctomycetia bacterium]|nr:YkgJ family cysteine cluster protein [Planctomycetia bacterium]
MASTSPKKNPRLRKKPKRSEIPPGEDICQYCSGKCCRYFALEIDAPVDWEDYDHIRWYLLHENAAVFTENEGWFLLFHSRCKCLDENNRCTDYENRPNVCRQYTTDRCEYDDDWVYDRYFETPEQVEEYAEAVLGPRLDDNIRTPRPEPPVILPKPVRKRKKTS